MQKISSKEIKLTRDFIFVILGIRCITQNSDKYKRKIQHFDLKKKILKERKIRSISYKNLHPILKKYFHTKSITTLSLYQKYIEYIEKNTEGHINACNEYLDLYLKDMVRLFLSK